MVSLKLPENRYLGKLCKRGHDWNNTGQSLRRKIGKPNCVECHKITMVRWNTDNKLLINERRRKRYRENPEISKRDNDKWRKENREKVNKGTKLYNDNARLNMTDPYIRRLMRWKGYVPPELFKAKRIILELYRTIN